MRSDFLFGKGLQRIKGLMEITRTNSEVEPGGNGGGRGW